MQSSAVLARAVEMFGSQQKLGAAIGFTQNAIYRALRDGTITPLMAYRVHVATKGRVSYVDLCPLLDIRRQLAEARKHVKFNGVRR